MRGGRVEQLLEHAVVDEPATERLAVHPDLCVGRRRLHHAERRRHRGVDVAQHARPRTGRPFLSQPLLLPLHAVDHVLDVVDRVDAAVERQRLAARVGPAPLELEQFEVALGVGRVHLRARRLQQHLHLDQRPRDAATAPRAHRVLVVANRQKVGEDGVFELQRHGGNEVGRARRAHQHANLAQRPHQLHEVRQRQERGR